MPPATSHVCLTKVFPFIFNLWNKIPKITRIGKKHKITKDNFHEPKNAKINDIMNIKLLIRTFPKNSPRPNSINSNWDCIFEANSKILAESNQPSS